MCKENKSLFFEFFSYYSYEIYIFYAIIITVPVWLAGQGFPSTNPFCLFSPNTASISFTHFFNFIHSKKLNIIYEFSSTIGNQQKGSSQIRESPSAPKISATVQRKIENPSGFCAGLCNLIERICVINNK